MPSRSHKLLLNVQLGMTLFFFAGAIVAFLFLREQPSWTARNLWWISLIIAFADLAAFGVMAKRFRQASDGEHRK